MDLNLVLAELRQQIGHHQYEIDRLQTALAVLEPLTASPVAVENPPLPLPPPEEKEEAPTLEPSTFPVANDSAPPSVPNHDRLDPATAALVKRLRRWRIRYPVASSYIDANTSHGLSRQMLKGELVRSPKCEGLLKDYELTSIASVKTKALLDELCAIAGIDIEKVEAEGERLWRALRENGKPGVDYIVRPDEDQL